MTKVQYFSPEIGRGTGVSKAGVWEDQKLTFQREDQYGVDSTKTRICERYFMCSHAKHAVCPIMNYASVTYYYYTQGNLNIRVTLNSHTN